MSAARLVLSQLLKNLVMSAMMRNRAIGHLAKDLMVEYCAGLQRLDLLLPKADPLQRMLLAIRGRPLEYKFCQSKAVLSKA